MSSNRISTAGLPAAAPTAAPTAAQTPADKFIQKAMAFRGQPYQWGGGHNGTMAGPGPVDCSGLVSQAALESGMPNLTGTADSLQAKSKPIAMTDLKPGDLVFCGHPAHHVGIYVGNGLVLEAPHTGANVRLAPVTNFDSAGRVFDQAGQPVTQTQADAGSKGDVSTLGGGSRQSGMRLPSLDALSSSWAASQARDNIDKELAKQGLTAASSGNIKSGLKSVDSKSTGGMDALMAKLAAMGISQEDLEAMSEKYGVPLNMILAVIQQESGGDPNATSGAGAQGLMQLMPDTAKELGVTNSLDPKQNVEGGVKLLAANLARYNGSTELALAAYNAGPGNVAKYGGVPPFPETQNYVAKITDMMGPK